MNKAVHLRRLDDWKGDAALYRVTPPMAGYGSEGVTYEYVIASAVVPGYGMASNMPETLLFGATPDGEVACWTELPGSYRGGLSHAAAFRNAGDYTILFSASDGVGEVLVTVPENERQDRRARGLRSPHRRRFLP